jgi:hypothetical protein
MVRCKATTSPGGAAACNSTAASPTDAPAGFLRRRRPVDAVFFGFFSAMSNPVMVGHQSGRKKALSNRRLPFLRS